MRSGAGFYLSTVIDTLQEEVDLIEAALARPEIASETP